MAQILALLALGSCAGKQGRPPAAAADLDAVPERVARGLVELSPPADPSDAAARDAAGERLSRFAPLLDAAGDRILWSGFDPKKGFALKKYSATEFLPMVWARMYLSTYTFPGPYEIRREGKYSVVEIAARFRSGLDPGDYPYPFWHSQKKWQAYLQTGSLLLFFERDRLVAALRKADADSAAAEARAWDGRWRWTNEDGSEQPRVALFRYLFSRDNPRVPELEATYRKLELAFRTENCTSCHAPDNPSRASRLLLLDFPNQALVGRHDLVEILRANKMPPADRERGRKAGIDEEATRQHLLRLAEEFAGVADSALAFEQAALSTSGGVH